MEICTICDLLSVSSRGASAESLDNSSPICYTVSNIFSAEVPNMKKITDRKLLFFSAFISTLFLLICSRSSPLYPMNDWEDVHIFFTLGRSVTDGLVLYRDVYDQKGPLLYFLFTLASCISRTTFLGVFVMEAVTFTAFLYFSAKCAVLHLGRTPALYAILTLMAPALTLSTSFANGSSAEQYCLWIIPFSLYLIEKALHESRRLRASEAFAIGACAGWALYIKFTILGFFFGLALYVLIWYVVYEKGARDLMSAIFSFLLGIAAVSVPIFLYFLANDAIPHFLTGYFYNNLFLYQGESDTLKERLVSYYVFTKNTFYNNLEFTIIAIIGGAWLALTPRKNHKRFTAFFLGFLFLSIATLGGGRFYPYYTFIYGGFLVYGFIALTLLLRNLFPNLYLPRKRTPLVLTLLLALLLPTAYFCSDDTYFMAYEKEDLPQYQFAAYINQKEDASMLYYGFLDGGFYFTAGVTPPCRYIGWLNIPLEDMSAAQEALIDDAAVDFVVTRTYELDSPHYRFVAQGEMPPGEEEPEVYYLYEKIT